MLVTTADSVKEAQEKIYAQLKNQETEASFTENNYRKQRP